VCSDLSFFHLGYHASGEFEENIINKVLVYFIVWPEKDSFMTTFSKLKAENV